MHAQDLGWADLNGYLDCKMYLCAYSICHLYRDALHWWEEKLASNDIVNWS